MLCEICSSPAFPGARGRKPRFCSTRCRVAAHRRKTLPAELLDLDRWIRHEAKRPIQINGRAASSTDSTTWSTYSQARESQAGDGLGFVLNGDGITCIDLDYCLEDGITSQAREILEAIPSAYVEVSPSGRGLHVWVKSNLQKGHRFTLNGQNVEIYPNGRYITITGNVYRAGGLPTVDLDPLIAKRNA